MANHLREASLSPDLYPHSIFGIHHAPRRFGKNSDNSGTIHVTSAHNATTKIMYHVSGKASSYFIPSTLVDVNKFTDRGGVRLPTIYNEGFQKYKKLYQDVKALY